MPAPIPELLPVMRARFPLSCKSMGFLDGGLVAGALTWHDGSFKSLNGV